MPTNQSAERDNPCLKEQKLTYDCLNKYDFDREKCQLHFINYNNCKEFWGKVRSMRRSQGIRPFMPDIEDRPKIKEEYFKAPSN